jgi:hypothetical protein
MNTLEFNGTFWISMTGLIIGFLEILIKYCLHLLTFQTPIIYKPFINNYLYIFFTFLVIFLGTYFSGRS